MLKIKHTIMFAILILAGCQSEQDKDTQEFLDEIRPLYNQLASLASNINNPKDFNSIHTKIQKRAEQFSASTLGDTTCIRSEKCLIGARNEFDIDGKNLGEIYSLLKNADDLRFRVKNSNFIDIDDRSILPFLLPHIAQNQPHTARSALIHNYIDPAACSTVHDLGNEVRSTQASQILIDHIKTVNNTLTAPNNSSHQIFRSMTILPLGKYDVSTGAFSTKIPRGQWGVFPWYDNISHVTYRKETTCPIEPKGFTFSFHFQNASEIFNTQLLVDATLADKIIERWKSSTSGFPRHLIAVFEFTTDTISQVNLKMHPYSENNYSVETYVQATRVLFYMPPRHYEMARPVGGAYAQTRDIILKDGPFRRHERKLNSLIPIIEPLFEISLN